MKSALLFVSFLAIVTAVNRVSITIDRNGKIMGGDASELHGSEAQAQDRSKGEHSVTIDKNGKVMGGAVSELHGSEVQDQDRSKGEHSVTIDRNGKVTGGAVSELHGSKAQAQHRSKGEHSEAFTKAYDAISTELELKQATLADWLSVNCITSKETELANKQKEIMDYKGESDYWWEAAWSAIKRTWLNMWFDKANRLLHEEAALQAELDAMKAEKTRLQGEVADMEEKKTKHTDDANVLLEGLNTQVTALVADLASYQSEKTTTQNTHNERKEKMIQEDASAVDVFTQLIANLDAAIHEKRDLLYSVTATCAQYEKEGKDECKKCDGDERACGDTCISKSERCNEFPGCTCDATIGHTLHQEFNETRTALEDTIKYQQATINSHSHLLNQTQTDIERIQADKDKAIETFNIQKSRLEALKTQSQKDKSIAEQAKQNATDALASATEENEAAVSGLAGELRNAILALQASRAENVASKSALLAAQATKMKELLETHGAAIAAWDARILSAESEKAHLQHEAADLSTAIGATTSCQYVANENTAVSGQGTGGEKLSFADYESEVSYLQACKDICNAELLCGGFVDDPTDQRGRMCKPKTASEGYAKDGKTFYKKGSCPTSTPNNS